MMQDMDFIEKCLRETEQYKVNFAEGRIFSTLGDGISVKNGQIDNIGSSLTKGFSIRVILNGAWGYASSSEFKTEFISSVVKQAVEIAKASAMKLRKPVELTEEPVIVDTYSTPYKKDPFEIDLDERLEILKNADKIMKSHGDQIKVSQNSISASRMKLVFGNSEGTRITQEQTFMGCEAAVTAVGKDVQSRNATDYQMRGFEFVEEFNFEKQADLVAKEALLLVNDAENCPDGKTTFILEPYQLGLTIHESSGHSTELDRALGFEADFAGTSFLTKDKLGKNFKFGSELVNIICDATIPNIGGHYKYDDEGVTAKKFHVIENGIFKNYMTDRETAHEVGYKNSFGNSRLSNYNRIPIVRMGHLYLAPDPSGPKNIDELISETKDGIYGQFWKSHSIDDKRSNFQFSTQIGWVIKNGEITKPLKNVCYNSSTTDFWENCDMITQEKLFYGFGPSCGKGIPMQAMWVSHGGGWARFQDISVFAG